MPVGTSQKVQDKIIANLTKNGSELISFEKGRKVRYRCSCGNETESHTFNLCKSTWGGCAKCSNQRRGNKNNYEFARKVWEEGGEVLPKQEYKGNKDKMHYTCSNCGEEAHISLSEFRRGRRCENCAKSRAKDTNLERYGVENVFQSEEIKQRIKDSNTEKYGVEHHMKVPEILQKAIDTNIDRYGLAFAFHSEESFDKIRDTCMERYGVEYPLQNEYIQEKVIQSCRERLGVDYPFESKEFLDSILTPDYREKARATMLKLYGVEYASQSDELFYKMMVSGYQRKEYTFPSGRVEYCQGYEPRCLDHLLETYDEDDIVVGYKGREAIWYPNPDKDGKLSRYFPDGFIKSENAIIEVKSNYYYEKDIAKNHAKFKAVTPSRLNILYCSIYQITIK
jgi:hypothetical protein